MAQPRQAGIAGAGDARGLVRGPRPACGRGRGHFPPGRRLGDEGGGGRSWARPQFPPAAPQSALVPPARAPRSPRLSAGATYGSGEAGFVDVSDSAGLARLRPLNSYGWSKHLFDRWAIRQVESGRPSPQHWAGVKFFNVYGPNEYHKGAMQSLVAKLHPKAVAGEPATF